MKDSEVIERYKKGERDFRGVNLSGGFDLSGADLSDVNLERAILSGFDLSGADLSDADLSDADLKRADLIEANLRGANLEGANLERANLREANLREANLEGASLWGANLREANLEGADLIEASLWGANLGEANLEGANLKRAFLWGANLGEANLERVNLRGAYLRGAILRGTVLEGAVLSGANLSGANLSGLDLSRANLSEADLSEIIGLRTMFKDATLTGACIEDWNINSQTNLKGVICDYIYLKKNQQERRPSSGIFQQGEFTKLFEEVLDTVDLIFRNGVDWKAFTDAFKKVQVENEDTLLEIQTIENKGDGVVVVKVKVPPDTNKEKIHQDFTQNYELALQAVEEKYKAILAAKEEKIEDTRQYYSEMKEIVKILASKQSIAIAMADKQEKNVEVEMNISGGQQDNVVGKVTANTYNQSGNFGIGHMSGGTIAEGAKVAGVINEAQQQDLAQAAAEIQKLLKQLEQSYPTDTYKGKVALADEVVSQIDNDPTLAQRILSALSAGGVNALDSFLNHPAASFVIGALEDWQNTKK